jgi:hypothetical protein
MASRIVILPRESGCIFDTPARKKIGVLKGKVKLKNLPYHEIAIEGEKSIYVSTEDYNIFLQNEACKVTIYRNRICSLRPVSKTDVAWFDKSDHTFYDTFERPIKSSGDSSGLLPVILFSSFLH